MMAGDWIKIRVSLSRDPKVFWMADYLAHQAEFVAWLTDPVQRSCAHAYEHVTRNVTVALCVTGLVTVWGTAVERGVRSEDDLLLSPCNAQTVSSIAGIPCFGESMQQVGWLQEIGEDAVVFRKYFAEQENPHVKHRLSNAERQAKYRLRKRNESNADSVTQRNADNVTRNVTNNAKQEKRRDTWSMDPRDAGEHAGDVDQKHEGKKTRKPVRPTKPDQAGTNPTRQHARSKPKGAAKLRTAVTVDAIADQASEIFRACRYTGDQGGNLWGVAALMETGVGDLSEAEVYSAARGAALNGKNKPAHFFACLSETLSKRGQDLTSLLREVAILPEWPKECPSAGV